MSSLEVLQLIYLQEFRNYQSGMMCSSKKTCEANPAGKSSSFIFTQLSPTIFWLVKQNRQNRSRICMQFNSIVPNCSQTKSSPWDSRLRVPQGCVERRKGAGRNLTTLWPLTGTWHSNSLFVLNNSLALGKLRPMPLLTHICLDLSL